MLINSTVLVAGLMIFLLIIFTVLLFHKGSHYKSNIYLGIYFISQIIGIANSLLSFEYQHVDQNYIHLFYVGQPVYNIWGPCFFLYICSLLNPSFRISYRSLFHFIPALTVAIFLAINFYFKTGEEKSQMIANQWLSKIAGFILTTFFDIQIIGYNIAALYKYFIYRTQLKANPSFKNLVPGNWIKIALFGFSISCLIVQFGHHFGKFQVFSQINWYFTGNLTFFLYFNVLFYVAITSRSIIDNIEVKEKYKNSPITEETALKLLEQLDFYMLKNKPFKDPELSLKGLAFSLNISERYLSQIINEHKKQNFSDFINLKRIEYAMDLLKNTVNKQRTMLDILSEAGFNSKTAFNAAFKKFAGCTPSEYKKKMNEIPN